jgi:hypothetical protein
VIGPTDIHLIDVPWPSALGGPGAPGFGLAYWWWVRRAARVLREQRSGVAGIYFHGGAVGALRWLGNLDERPLILHNPHGMEEFGRAGLLRWIHRAPVRSLSRCGRDADWVMATDRSLLPHVVRNIGATTDRWWSFQTRLMPTN